jgi:hypothetical protein
MDSVTFYTLTSTLPLVLISAVLLFTNLDGTSLVTLSLLGMIVGIVGFSRLLYEITLDLAGYPDYKLPVWTVFYLIIYLISVFTFLFFAMHTGSPGRFFGGIAGGPKAAYIDALYISLSNYIGQSPDPLFKLKTQSARFLSVTQGVLSMFLNLVIIGKFVGSF